MSALVFSGVPGVYRLDRIAVLATPGRSDAVRTAVPGTPVTEVPPATLRARLDPASRLAELAATALTAEHPLTGDPGRRGVFVASRRGNQESVRRFAGSLSSGRRSPVTFSVAGYNIVAQSVARALPANGPSVVLAGRRASLDGALLLGALRLCSRAIDTAVVGVCSWEPGGDGVLSGEGVSVMVTLVRAAALPEAEEPQRIDPRASFAAVPAGPPGRDGLSSEDAAALRRIRSAPGDAAPGRTVLTGVR
ncbi:hypothetical protein [Streptacidiphilus sp. EB103A]|uniref:hypothetical protein n=1 Tax=Streptacidiphilus sp. EB103A TaxID=3156275 RepID=UPI003511E086